MLVDIEITRVFLTDHAAAAMMKTAVRGIGAYGIEAPLANLCGRETNLPNFSAVPESGDLECSTACLIIENYVGVNGLNRIFVFL